VAFLSGTHPDIGTVSPSASIHPELSSLRVAIVHDWFYVRGGAERVVEALADIFPHAELFALFARTETMAPNLRKRKLTTSWLQNIPGIHRFHRYTLILHPLALEQFNFNNYDLVISSVASTSKGIITSPNTLHLCYCHSPMRYIWDMYSSYLRDMSPIDRLVFALTAHKIRLWDYSSSSRVDHFACNSQYVAARIEKFYRRSSEVIYPPVEVKSVQINNCQEDFYLAVGRLVGYKRFDLAIQACNRLGRRLKIAGSGPDLRKLKQMAGPDAEFLGLISDDYKHELLGKCRALIFPGEEDFGIVPVEAQAHGRPVIAFQAGGALETVTGLQFPSEGTHVPTGVFFAEQTVGSLVSAIERFEKNADRFDPIAIRNNAMRFDTSVFQTRVIEFVERKIRERGRVTSGF
jgi:glycosyltransferase involved in cell wall biosynthesis